ncbi:hypothetical protein CQA49_07145 [Helicobacter sp. MIT 00-7814]|nr:hypothetical protein CQA37_08125 [Helicobacter sp. MIT 99-10781]RDU53119.1 hypothetical protein CQA49_07145 [Helicobacter sp. MIT 00-7814]
MIITRKLLILNLLASNCTKTFIFSLTKSIKFVNPHKIRAFKQYLKEVLLKSNAFFEITKLKE